MRRRLAFFADRFQQRREARHVVPDVGVELVQPDIARVETDVHDLPTPIVVEKTPVIVEKTIVVEKKPAPVEIHIEEKK